MKKLAVVLALSSSAVFAQDLKLGDLNFFQKAGSVQWNTEVGMGKSEYSDRDAGATDTEDFEGKRTSWSNTVTYGLSDKFNLGLAFSYDLKNEVENTKALPGNDKDKTYDQNGLSDFTILGNYRLMDQDFYVDLNAGLTVALGDAEVGSSDNVTSKDGNNKQGHHDLNLGVAVGQKMNALEWRAGLGLNYHFSGEKEHLNTNGPKVTEDTDASLDYGLNAAVQYRVIPELALSLGLDWTQVGEAESEAKAGGGKVKITKDSHSILGVNLVAKYNLSDSMLVNAGYRFTTAYDIDESENDGTTTDKMALEDNKNSVIFVGASFLF